MSFSNDCKTELSKEDLGTNAEIMAELEAFLRMSSELVIRNGQFTISFESGNAMVAKRYLSIVKKLYKAKATLLTHQVERLDKGIHYNVVLESEAETIIAEFNMLGESQNKDEIDSNELSRKAYLRAAFLSKGSISDPKNGDYHLEIPSTDQENSIFIQRLMNEYDLNAKIVKRRNEYVVYVKDAASISDFLRIVGASQTAFSLDENVIKREYHANLVRQMNAEIANEMKTLSAANRQVKEINLIMENYDLDKLDDKTKTIMDCRLKNPEASFAELLKILASEYKLEMTKSGLNHKFIKIRELAESIEG